MLANLASSRLKRGLLVTAAFAVVALLALGGLPVLRQLYAAGWVAPEHYHVAFAALCILPAAAVHVAATLAGAHWTFWWSVWLPGVVVYAAFPWQGADGWRPLWIFGHAWDWGRTIFLHWEAAGPFVFNSFGSFVTMLTVTVVAFGRLWAGAAKAIGRAGSDALAADDAGDALPSADWASTGDVVKRFSVSGGIVLGELTDPTRHSRNFAPGRRRSWGRQGRGQLITMSPTDGNGHVLVTSQSSGYKSTGLVIPNILTYDGPLVVFDPKCELYARTRHARLKMGYTPVVIDAENGFDPVRLIAALAEDHPSAYLRMAKMVIPKSDGGIENAKYFKAAAIKLFTALLAHHAETGSTSILQDIAELLAQAPDDVHAAVADEIAESKLPFVRNQLGAIEDMDPKFWASITTEITNQLMFSEMPDVERYITLQPGSKLPSQVIDPRCDVFLNIPQNIAEDFAPMLRVMLGSMLTAAQLVEINEAPRAHRLFLIDEAAKLGAMDILENIRDRGRSLGLVLMLFYQTPGEIENLWGRAGMTSWRDGCSATVMGPVSSRTSAQDVSAMMGTRTLRVKTESTSSSSQVMSPMAGSVSTSEQETLRDVPLISPTAISQLPPHASIITATGMKPMLASKAIWFTRPDMKGRVRNTEEIKDEVAATELQETLTQRLEELTQADEETAGLSSVSRSELAAMQRRNMDDDPEPVDDGRLEERAGAAHGAEAHRPGTVPDPGPSEEGDRNGPGDGDDEGVPLSERARERAPRYHSAKQRGERFRNGGEQDSDDLQPGNGTPSSPNETSEPAASGASAEAGGLDSGAIRVEDDVEAPFPLDGPSGVDARQPASGTCLAGTVGEHVPATLAESLGAAASDAEAAPLPDMEQEGPAPAREDVERDLGDADGSPPEAVEYGQAPAPASEHEDEESADSPPAPVDADTRAANVNAPPAADEETERTSDAKDRGDATGASEAPKSDSPAQSGDIDPSAIEDDFDPHWTEADPDPVSGPAASRSKTARDADGMGEAPANAREGKEATAPGVAKGGENVDTGKEGTRTSSGPENVAAREPEGDRVRTGGPDAGGGDDDDQVPVPVAAPGAPPDASDIDPPAIKIEDDFELLWATADPAPFPSGPDERTESDPGDHAVGDTWTREDAVRFMGLHYAGMSLADIAEELGKSRASVAAWEERQRARGLVPDSAGAGNEAASTGDGEAEDDGPGGPA